MKEQKQKTFYLELCHRRRNSHDEDEDGAELANDGGAIVGAGKKKNVPERLIRESDSTDHIRHF